MIYKFHSKATGDMLMTAAVSDRVLAIIGRAPAAKGIFEVASMPAAMQAIEAAVAAEDATRGEAAAPAAVEADSRDDDVSLRQHAWPLLEMIKRAHAAGEVIVWGV